MTKTRTKAKSMTRTPTRTTQSPYLAKEELCAMMVSSLYWYPLGIGARSLASSAKQLGEDLSNMRLIVRRHVPLLFR